MTTAIVRRRIGTERGLHRGESRLFGRRAARPPREKVLLVKDNVGVLLSLLAFEDETDA